MEQLADGFFLELSAVKAKGGSAAASGSASMDAEGSLAAAEGESDSKTKKGGKKKAGAGGRSKKAAAAGAGEGAGGTAAEGAAAGSLVGDVKEEITKLVWYTPPGGEPRVRSLAQLSGVDVWVARGEDCGPICGAAWVTRGAWRRPPAPPSHALHHPTPTHPLLPMRATQAASAGAWRWP